MINICGPGSGEYQCLRTNITQGVETAPFSDNVHV
uniref:Uncharacterized protein n=1 Tax=Anguilla anguilla TaxID=7936 RepID=A0A0E9VQF6_ANGAN